MTATLPALDGPTTRATLDNGLRAVLAPDPTAPVVAVAVYYGVGIRSERPGRTGFAHLFEHLMFQGSGNVARGEHFGRVQAAGGTLNGSTHLDYTNYFETLPAGALELALYLEADRMRAVALTPENLANQIDVVKEEIRVNVLNQPYGGYPWLWLPAVLYDTYPNAHNGYGEFADLEAASLEDAESFFDRWYAPSNAVVCVAGDLDPDRTLAMVERHFGDIRTRPAPQQPDLAEPPPDGEQRGTHRDPHAPLPAVTVAWRLPDPLGPLEEYLPYVLLADVLGAGDASRLERAMVQRTRTATDVLVGIGTMGGAMDVRDPTAMLVDVRLPSGTSSAEAIAVLDEELRRLASDGPGETELERVRAYAAARRLRRTNSLTARAQQLAVLELLRGDPELLARLPDLLRQVSGEQLRAAAAALAEPPGRAVLELVPATG